jgi:peptide deformylase
MEIVVPPEFQVLWQTNASRPVLKYPSDVLRKKAKPVQRITQATRLLASKMLDVLQKSNGIGLAAPQIGTSERVIIVAPSDIEPLVLVNPEITSSEGTVVGEEGCLSLPGLYGDVTRSAIIDVNALGLNGKRLQLRLEGLAARVAQHELDHLDGILFIDKVDLATLHWAWPVGADAE